jgi:hypothetical protein
MSEILNQVMEYLGYFLTIVSILELFVAGVLKRDLFAKSIYKFVAMLARIDPYSLNGKKLSFKTLNNMIKEGMFSENGTFKLAFVVGSCRIKGTPGSHFALATDLAFTPEIALQIRELLGNKIEVKTLLDLDVNDDYRDNWNLVLTGGGNINAVTAGLFEKYHEELRVRAANPTEAALIGLSDNGRKRYTPEESANVGALIACVNPWAKIKNTKKNRLIIVAFGLGATGTMAALHLLLEYLEGSKEVGDNLLDSSVPARIVRAELGPDSADLRSPDEIIPCFDIRSFKKAICIE